MAAVHFTKKQTKHIERLVALYASRTILMECLPMRLKAHIQLINSMIEDGIGFDQTEWEVLTWILELYFGSFTEDDIDPLAEQAYAKICGEWPFDEPWYDRMLDVVKPLSHKGVRDYKLGT
jgi:hypothetical protein